MVSKNKGFLQPGRNLRLNAEVDGPADPGGHKGLERVCRVPELNHKP